MAVNTDKYDFRFREWDIHKGKYALVDQTRRALNSIVLNIAEGANKNTDKDMRVYINRAHCSLDEVVSCLDCALDDGYLAKENHNEVLQKVSSLAKRLRAFSCHLSMS